MATLIMESLMTKLRLEFVVVIVPQFLAAVVVVAVVVAAVAVAVVVAAKNLMKTRMPKWIEQNWTLMKKSKKLMHPWMQR
jgi:hypothetical protein